MSTKYLLFIFSLHYPNHFLKILKFGDPRVQQLKMKRPIRFGAAVRTVDGDQGIMGLTYIRKTDVGSSIIGEAIKQGLFDRPLFSIYLRRCPENKQECTEAGNNFI